MLTQTEILYAIERFKTANILATILYVQAKHFGFYSSMQCHKDALNRFNNYLFILKHYDGCDYVNIDKIVCELENISNNYMSDITNSLSREETLNLINLRITQELAPLLAAIGDCLDLSGSSDTICELIANNTNNIANNTANIATNTANISTNTANINSLSTTVSSFSTSITSLTSSVSTNTTNIAANTANIAGLTTTVNSHTTTLASHTTSIATNASNISANATNISNNATDIATLQASMSTLLALTHPIPKTFQGIMVEGCELTPITTANAWTPIFTSLPIIQIKSNGFTLVGNNQIKYTDPGTKIFKVSYSCTVYSDPGADRRFKVALRKYDSSGLATGIYLGLTDTIAIDHVTASQRISVSGFQSLIVDTNESFIPFINNVSDTTDFGVCDFSISIEEIQ